VSRPKLKKRRSLKRKKRFMDGGIATVRGTGPRKDYGDVTGAVTPLVARAGDCYLWAMRVVARAYRVAVDLEFLTLVMKESGHRHIVLVHGYPRRQAHEGMVLEEDGIPLDCRFGHAWVELRGSKTCESLAYDPVSMSLMDASLYYQQGEIERSKCHVYNREEAHRRASTTNLPGPWEDYAGSELVRWRKEA
jgi:hypothetical protein